MDGAAWLLEARAQAAPSYSPTMGGPRGIFQLAGVGNQSQSSAAQIINDLRFAAAKSIRTSTIILAAFNAVAAFSTAFGILYDCYATRRRNNRRYRTRYDRLRRASAAGERGDIPARAWIGAKQFF